MEDYTLGNIESGFAAIIFAAVILFLLAVGILTNPRLKEIQDSGENEAGHVSVSEEELTGEYRMDVPVGILSVPTLILESDKSFSFSYDLLSSHLPFGIYTFDGMVLTAVTNDGKYHYKFLRKENGVLAFIEEESSPIAYIEDGVEIKDGTEFFKREGNISEELPEKNEITEIIEAGGAEDITIIPPVVTVDTSLGADGILLDFADENLVILHGSGGFFVYSKTEDEMVGAVDLEDIGCHYTQGDNYCEVTVEPNGTKVYLHPLSEKIMYVYDVEKKSLQKKSYQAAEMERGKVLTLVTNECIEPDHTVFRSYNCAEVVTNNQTQYGYLESGSGLWKDICYIEGNMRINLFNGEK